MQSALTPHSGRDNARIALLTPGPHHEDYFSHAYLARYLGYLLVEGSDLRTKGNQVYLKTLEGLKEIDLIVRCVDGRSIDPLELDPAGFDGPAGLLRVCRKSPRLVVNAVGSALVAEPRPWPLSAALAEHLLGEDLALPDAPRRWLGDAPSHARMCSTISIGLVIRKAQEGTGRPGQAALGQDPRALSAAERARSEAGYRAAWRRARGRRKDRLQHRARLSSRRRLAPQPFAVRLFVATYG